MRARRFAIAALALTFVGGGPPATAQEGGLAAHDASQPIEINADRLEVNQKANEAKFFGNVEAVQGGMHLRSDQMRVVYALGEGSNDGQAVRRIEVEGNVVITSPSETARGQSGFYDVPGNKIELEGDVVLERGGNVIKGARLDVDLAASTAAVTAAPEGRVRALFLPQQGGS